MSIFDERVLKELGFASADEFQEMILAADISTPEKLKAFEKWKLEDGSKAGLVRLSGERT